MNELKLLPNISNVIAGKLTQAGIDTPEKLKNYGSREAFVKIKCNDPTACVNMLYSLEGALQGIRWHDLPAETKRDLKQFHHSL